MQTVGEVLGEEIAIRFRILDEHLSFVMIAMIWTADRRTKRESQPEICHENGLAEGELPSRGGRLLIEFLDLRLTGSFDPAISTYQPSIMVLLLTKASQIISSSTRLIGVGSVVLLW